MTKLHLKKKNAIPRSIKYSIIVCYVSSIFQIPIIYADSDDDSETENDKTTSENTERNKNIPAFGLEIDSEKDVDDYDEESDDHPQVIRGTVV